MFVQFTRIAIARRFNRLVLLVGCGSMMAAISVAYAATPARAMPDDVAVHGIVRDERNVPLSNVQVIVSGQNRSALTDDRGEFVFRGLANGTYHLDFARIGFAAEHRVVIVPASGPDVHVTVVMRVATVRLSSVNVTATPTGTDPLNVTQATVQLSAKELQRNLTASIGQTLSGEPGMATRFNGPLASAPVIRGLTGERVLVLQDGDRSGDLSAAAGDHLNAVEPSSAERIEVIRGPASLLYGNNALGGVVNVISNDIPSSIPSRRTGYVLGQGESVTPGGVMSAGVTMPLGDQVALTVRGGLRSFNDMRVGGGGVQPNTNGSTGTATVGAGYVGERFSIGAVYRHMEFEYGLPHDAAVDPVRLDGRRKMIAVQSTLGTARRTISSLKFNGTAQSYSHGEIESTGDVGTQFDLNTQTINATAGTSIGRAKGALGFQALLRQYTPTGSEAFTPGADNNNVALFAFQEIPLFGDASDEHSPRIQLGARWDRFAIRTRPTTADELVRFGNVESRDYHNVAASAGLSVPVARNVSATANVSRGFRAPTVEELFANGLHAAAGTFDNGNSALIPERSTGFEAGLRSQSSVTFAQANAYYNFIDHYIRPIATGMRVVDGAEVPVVEFRQDDAVLFGVEGQVETKLPHHFVGGVMGDITRARLREGLENLPYIPAGRLGASLRLDNGRWSAGTDVRRVFAQTRVSGDALDVATAAYTLWNLHASLLVVDAGSMVHSVTLRTDNVLDAQYREATSRIKSFAFNPGRNVNVVYKLLF